MNVDCFSNSVEVLFTYNKYFPIFLIKNFIVVGENYKKKIIGVILDNMNYHYNVRKKSGYNFPIRSSPDNFFLDTYDKFYGISTSLFGKLTPVEDCRGCHSYVTNSNGFGINRLHNHIQTSTISACYYFNIPKKSINDESSISFISWELNTELIYRPSIFDLIIFPNYLDHKINYSPHKENRITITMEIKCEEKSVDIFSIPFTENRIIENEKNLFKHYKKILL